MALVLTPIYTQTVGSSGAASITFNNIPQFYTDLQVLISIRDGSSSKGNAIYVQFNNSAATTYSNTVLYGETTGSGSFRNSTSTAAQFAYTNGANQTANTFASCQLYIPNYTNSNFKSFVSDSVTEENAANYQSGIQSMFAGLWRDTSAISSLKIFTLGNATIQQHSTFSLYGIIRSGA